MTEGQSERPAFKARGDGENLKTTLAYVLQRRNEKQKPKDCASNGARRLQLVADFIS